MKSIWKSEAAFQAACHTWFDKTYPEQRQRLIAIFNNPVNITGLISMGLKPGISDFLYRIDRPWLAWIELKIGGNTQSKAQEQWQARVEGWGDKYYVVTEYLEQFQQLIKHLNNEQ